MASLLRGTAFITGAASGIGQHTALAFARHGITRLALADINASALRSTTDLLRRRFPTVELLPLAVNVQNAAEVKAGISQITSTFGRLDIAVNNAGIGGSGRPTDEIDEAEFSRVLDVDLHGVWRCQREEIITMLKQEYDLTTKKRVLGLTKSDACTYGPKDIRINAICPGYVETPLVLQTMAQDADSPLARDIERTPFGRMAKSEEVADCITFLASDMSSFMQGAGLVADGGFTVQ
ncbi:short-chain dehydrogenase reductase sdr [Colletotrichum karsti]|uniref:Short-chain dehydrogenase reductase sdr n=1 Tax=Colletotrichum karsti TaxID=1095194 RepID=A0A9P6HSR1_9PEZI|nr:short-chain dehydrogenase reductase sdr [Colletotrichum karsti]KAF9869379.1 short-chain dehydrogenase reductase sdr [Colletotrichum karsti]